MKILVFESNLLWSSKFRVGLKGLGHEGVFLSRFDPETLPADLAIVNLSQSSPEPKQLISDLKAAGIRVVAHAGHKEKELLMLGKDAGADLLTTNGELSAKLEDVLARASAL